MIVTRTDRTPLIVVRRTKQVTVQEGQISCSVSFLVLGGLEGVVGILGMDVLNPLHILVDTGRKIVYPCGPLTGGGTALQTRTPPLLPGKISPYLPMPSSQIVNYQTGLTENGEIVTMTNSTQPGTKANGEGGTIVSPVASSARSLNDGTLSTWKKAGTAVILQ